MEFHDRLQEIIIRNDLNRLELAKILKISRQCLYTYEYGKHKPTYEVLEILANYLDVSVDWLMCRTNVPTPPPKNHETIDRTLNEIDKALIIED